MRHMVGSGLALMAALIPSGALAQQSDAMTQQRATALFTAADTNADGLLQRQEWERTLPRSMRAQADLFWSRVATDGSAAITMARFITLLTTADGRAGQVGQVP
jgi:hypothetical protein